MGKNGLDVRRLGRRGNGPFWFIFCSHEPLIFLSLSLSLSHSLSLSLSLYNLILLTGWIEISGVTSWYETTGRP